MGVMKRLTSIVQAKANKVMDKVEDPRETLDMSYEKQLEQLQQVKRGVAEVATARKRLEIQAQGLQQQAAKYQDQARQALMQNREDLAQEALGRKAGIATQLEGLGQQHQQLVDQEQKLIATTQMLQARVESFRTQKETLKASYTAAQAQTRIGEAVSGISESMTDTGLAMQRAQDKIAQMQARASAVDELIASGTLPDFTGASDPLQAELDRTSQQSQVQLELARMKGELVAPAGAGALNPGQAGTGQAPPPQPAAIPGASQAPAEAADNASEEPAEAETVEPVPEGAPPSSVPAPPAPALGSVGRDRPAGSDLFTLDGGSGGSQQ